MAKHFPCQAQTRRAPRAMGSFSFDCRGAPVVYSLAWLPGSWEVSSKPSDSGVKPALATPGGPWRSHVQDGSGHPRENGPLEGQGMLLDLC